jgi:hypothetical protein
LLTTDNNDININKLSYKVDTLNGNSWVWEVKEQLFYWNWINSWNFAFIPTIDLKEMEFVSPETIMRDFDTTFSWTLKKDTSKSISDFKIQNILDIDDNKKMAFQNFTSSGTVCYWQNTATWYSQIWSDCNFSSTKSSNLLQDVSLGFWIWEKMFTFTSIPRIVSPSSYDIKAKYSSILSYEIDNNSVKYYSLKTDFEWINQQVKIAWIANSGFDVLAAENNNFLNTWLSMPLFRKSIAQNVENLKNSSNVAYFTWDKTISSWPSWKDTIIIEGWDLIINWDIKKTNVNKLNAIVVLKWDNWNGWNVWINQNVNFVSAIIFADKHLISGNWTIYYSDNEASAKNQLVIKWSIITYNTVWWASDPTWFKCPYPIEKNVCDLQTAKRYDLNFFRKYYSWISNWNAFDTNKALPDVINMSQAWYKEASMIIEYDSRILTNSPEIFMIK